MNYPLMIPQNLMIQQYELIDRVRSYDPGVDVELLNRAYVYGTKKHGDQKRASGDPYFSHPVEVAGILAAMKLDSATIATALLHDTIEDTSATRAEIAEFFGEEVAGLVEGVTKFSILVRVPEEKKRAENFKKLLLAMAGDARVLLVKLADRLHNMRTLEHISDDEKRRLIAQETMDIYVPLAGRMGMFEVREELEDLAFRYINPRARRLLRERLKPLVREKGEVLHNIADELKRKFAQHGVNADVGWRMKKPWSIWLKMEQKSISLEQLSDLMGFRIIVPNIEDCYRALGLIHTTWRNIPGRFKDYISTPKPNGYQSIHSTIIGPKQQRIEVQIRTQLMHEMAEYGIASHWRYKENNGKHHPELKTPLIWLRQVVEMLEDDDSAQEFLEHTKMEMFLGHILCFTIKGRLIVLPKGASPIDFAYAVHTDIGNSCASARVNKREVSLRSELKDGDEVEIIRAKNAAPSPAWEAIVKTGKARSAIRRALREQQKQARKRLGHEILSSIFRMNNHQLLEDTLERALGPFALENISDLYVAVAQGKIAARDVLLAVHPEHDPDKKRKWHRVRLFGRKRDKTGIKVKIPIRGPITGSAIEFAPGCFPVPGDRIVGILQPEKGVIVYPIGAPALSEFETQPERWIDLSWDIVSERTFFLARIKLTLAHEIGALAAITALIAEYQSNIDHLDLIQSDLNFRSLRMDIEVRDLQHLKAIVKALKGLRVVHDAAREEW